VKVLLDSHTLIWAVDNPTRLGAQAAVVLRDKSNELLLSAATIWELSIKFGLGKLSLSSPFAPWCNQAITDLGIAVVPITVEYSAAQSTLPRHHGDPFDRMLVAQALVERVTIVSADDIFERYGLTRVW
jgi:PIN domain nuclease of toxin-antitoxin system